MSTRQVAFLGFAILVLAPIAYFLFRDGSITNYPPKNQTIVAFGDSLVEGVGATPGNDFVSLVERTLRVDIINKGKSGDTTAHGLARIDEVLVEDPGIVILLLGGNFAFDNLAKDTI